MQILFRHGFSSADDSLKLHAMPSYGTGSKTARASGEAVISNRLPASILTVALPPEVSISRMTRFDYTNSFSSAAEIRTHDDHPFSVFHSTRHHIRLPFP